MGRLDVAVTQRLEHAAVVRQCARTPLGVVRVQPVGHVAGGVGQEPGQLVRAGSPVEAPVDRVLGVHHAVGVTGRGGLLEFVDQTTVELESFRVVAGDGPVDDALGEFRLEPEDVLDVLAAHRRDQVAAPRHQIDEALAAQGE